MTKCTASWEPSDVSFQSNKALKIGGDNFTPPPYQTRVNDVCVNIVDFVDSFRKKIVTKKGGGV